MGVNGCRIGYRSNLNTLASPSRENEVLPHRLNDLPGPLHPGFDHEHISGLEVLGLLAFRRDDAVAVEKVAELPLLIVHLELAGGANPGAHDLAAVLGQISIEVHGVRVAADALPLGCINDGSRAGFAQNGNEIGHIHSKPLGNASHVNRRGHTGACLNPTQSTYGSDMEAWTRPMRDRVIENHRLHDVVGLLHLDRVLRAEGIGSPEPRLQKALLLPVQLGENLRIVDLRARHQFAHAEFMLQGGDEVANRSRHAGPPLLDRASWKQQFGGKRVRSPLHKIV